MIFKYKNCKEASKDKETVCKVCDDGYYISGFGMCAQEGKVVVDEYGTTLDINITDCL
ncbi:MAG: hypothetical protein DHS20C13_26090 [Thermodesulfobacteriota bacterium]|nr:MAG: hypothetical protein DHS20C13_26090 [Thermodesulfobacteriota bacterium]